MKKLFSPGRVIGLLLLVLAGYLGFCLTIYLTQQQRLFAAHYAPPVGQDWRPSAGTHHLQVMLQGQCGKLHVVRWETANPKGVIMVFHGNGESIVNVESWVPMFQALGYSVMGWDYPGYGRSTACPFTEESLLQDAETAYQWLAADVPDRRIVLYGHSLGTGLALHVASQHPGHLVLLVSPYDSLTGVAADHMPWLPIAWIIRYPMRADAWIGRVQGSIHAIHGLADTLILPERARELMRQARGNADIEWVEGVGHNDAQLFANINRWLE